MSETEALARRAFDLWNSDDADGWLAMLDPSIEFQPAGIFPELGPVFYGHEGMLEFTRKLREPFTDFRVEVEKIETREDRGVATIRFWATGEGGEDVDLRMITGFEVRDGLIARMISGTTVPDVWLMLSD
jgi:ketosteroid isomerase-like protein